MRPALMLTCLVAASFLAPSVSAHERYFSSDDQYLIILGEQDEPVYTYDWTNLDFFVRDNATGDGIEDVHTTVSATLIAPNGEELSMALRPQHGATGEYQFEEDYFLTLPGQYKVRLEGDVGGTDISGEYLLPGPRGDMKPQAFPNPVDADLSDLADQNAALEARIAALEQEIQALKSDHSASHEDGDSDEAKPAPAFGIVAVLAAIGVALMLRRRG